MAAVISGNSLGLLNSSLYVLGPQGALGQATQGRSGDQVYVNAASGNVVIQNRDELLVGRGPDLSFLRTYNSQGLFDGDNGDNWRFGVYRKVYNLTGTVNTAGSTVTRVAEGGSESVYTYDTAVGKYVCHDGGGAYDTLAFTSATQTWTWSWTDGTNQLTELYDAANGGRVTKVQDQDGNALTFVYNAAGLITQVTDADGESTFLDYSGTNLTQLRTVNSAQQTLVRTRYEYDTSNRLIKVTTDLTPDVTTDAQTYVVNYSYDGTSKRVASITQTDGNNLSFTYIQVGSDWKVQSYTDATNKTTSISYTQSASSVQTSANANSNVLSTTETQTTTTTVAPYYTVAGGDTWTSITQTVYGTSSANAAAALQSSLGNPALTAGARLTVPQTISFTADSTTANANGAVLSTTDTQSVTRNLNSGALSTTDTLTANLNSGALTAAGWAAATAALDNLTQAASVPQVGFDSQGRAVALWLQNSHVFAGGYSANVWGAPVQVDSSSNTNAVTVPQLFVDAASGNAIATWVQGDPATGNVTSAWVNRFVSGAWQGAQLVENLSPTTNTTTAISASINGTGKAVVAFVQAGKLFANLYNGTSWGTLTSVPQISLTSNSNAVSAPSSTIDSTGKAIVTWQQNAGTNTFASIFANVYNGTSWAGATEIDTSTTVAATAPQVRFDGSGKAWVVFIQNGDLLARQWNGTAWVTGATNLETGSAAVSSPQLYVDASGNAAVAWVQNNPTAANVFVNRFTGTAWQGAQAVSTSTSAQSLPTVAINASGTAVAAYLQTSKVFASRFTGTSWSAGAAIPNADTAAVSTLPGIGLDAQGNAAAVWAQDATANIYSSYFDAAAYYSVPSGGTWNSIAQALYGNSDLGSALQSAMGSPILSTGLHLKNLPASVTGTVTVPPYYAVPAGATWASVATALYGNADVAPELQAALGNPPPALTTGAHLTGLPASLTHTTTVTVAPYYTVQAGNTWSSIAQAVYGDVAAAGPLQAALGNPTLTAGLHLTVPASLTFNPANAAANAAALSTTDTQTTNYSLNSGALTNPAGGWASPTAVETSSTAASQLVMGANNGGQAVSVWLQGGSLFSSVYDPVAHVWTAPVSVSGSFTNISGVQLDVDYDYGNAVVTWIDAATNRVYANRGTRNGSSVDWQGAQLVATASGTLAEAAGGINKWGTSAVLWRAVSGTTQSLMVSRWNGTAWGAAEQVASGTVAITAPQMTINPGDVIQLVWRASDGTAESLFTRGYNGAWGTTTTLEASSVPVSLFRIDTDTWGDTNVSWVQGNDIYVNWGGEVQGWRAAQLQATSPSAVTDFAYSDSSGITGAVAWIGADGNVYAYLWGSASPVVIGTGTGLADVAIDVYDGSTVIVSWRAANDLFASRFVSGAWSAAQPMESGAGAAATPRVAVDQNGEMFAVWQQSDGTANSIFASRYGTGSPYYTVQAGDTWASIGQTLYGNSAVASALQSAMGNPALTTGAQLTGFPATLSVTSTVTVPAYYTVQSGNTWATITQAVYGTSDANAQLALRDALGNPPLTAGSRLTPMPSSIRYAGPAGTVTANANNAVLSTTTTTTTTTTVAPYYAVQTGDSWASIAQAVYGDAQAASALQTALGGGASPAAGAHLTVPQSLSYTKTIVSSLRTDITDPLGLMTSIVADGQGQITQILNPAVGGVRQSASYAYDANGNVAGVTDARGLVTSYGYDANGNRTSERDAAGNTITRFFGSKNELRAETSYIVPDPDGAGAGLPGSPLTTRYVYDAGGHLRFVVSGEGRVSEYRYNGFGQRTAAIQYTGVVYDVTGFTPIQTPTEAQLVSFVNGADKTKTERIDSTYDFRGQLFTTTSYASVDASGAGVADVNQSVTHYSYDQAGNLLNTVDGRGSSTLYVYDGLGRLTQTTDAAGHPPTTIFYDDANKKTVLTSANGLVTTSTYDARGELVSVVQSATPGGVLGTTSYFYDADGRLRRTVDPTGISTHILYDEASRRIAAIDGTGSLTEYRYDADNNLTRTLRYASAVSSANLASLVDAQGNPTNVTLATIRPTASGQDRSTWNAYDSANQLVKSVDELGYVTQYFYDGAGRLTDVLKSAKAMTSTAALGDTPTPASINPATTDPLDRLTRNFYDADGKLRGTLDGEGYLVEYKYDAAGQPVETVGYATVTSAGLRTTGTLAQLIPTPTPPNPDDIHSYTLYNARRQVAGVVDGEGYLTETVYDLAGNKTQVVRYAAKVTYASGATVASLRPGGDAQDRASIYTYTALSQLASATDFEGTRTEYTYDEVGHPTKTVSAVSTADVRTLTAQYDKQGRLTAGLSGVGSALLTGNQTQQQIDAIWAANATKYAYDAAGRRTSSTDPNGNRALYYYDADGHLSHSINAAGEVKENKYNVLGQLTQAIAYGTRLTSTTLAGLTGGLGNTPLTSAVAGIANAALDAVTNYTYTARGQVASSSDPLLFATNNTYDAFGDLTGSSQQIGAGQTLDHTYDFDRRGLLTRTVWDPSVINASELRQYDAFGRAIQTTDANNNVRTRTYDRLGRVVTTTVDPGAGHLALGTSTTYDAFDRVLTQRDALNNVTTFSYDKTNRSVTMLTPELVSVTTVHNRQGETQSVTDGRGNVSKYDYDLDGNLKQVTRTNAQGQAIGTTVNFYDKADRLTDTVDANNNTVHYTYDAADRVLTRTVDTGAGHLNLLTTYNYDTPLAVSVTDANNLVTRTQFDLKGQTASVVVDPGTGHLNLTTTYAYDGRGRTLTVTEGVGSAQTRLTKYTYDKLGRRTQEQVDPNALNLTTTYAYDKNGNVVSRTEGAGKPEARTTRYVYDADDRLVWTVNAMGNVAKNEYDADGRVTKTIAYANALANFATLPPVPTAGDVTSRLTAAAGDEAVSHVYDKDGREVYTIDALGDVTQKVYDPAGNVIQTTAYSGRISVPASPTPASVAPLVAAANPNSLLNETTNTVYDAANRATFVIDAKGYVAQRLYDGNGNQTKEVRYFNPIQGTFTAGAAPQVVTVAPQTGSYVIIDARDQTTRQIYDAAGRMRYGVDAEGYVTERRLDGLGNETNRIRYADKATVADSATVTSMAALFPTIPATAVQEQAHYDNAGRLFEVIDGEGAVTRNLYDAVGNKTDVIRAFGTSAASTTHTVYDAAGRETEETAGYGSAVAATTRYGLDAFGNRTSIIDPRGVELAEQNTAWAQSERLRLGYFAQLAALSPSEQAALRAKYTTVQVFDKAGRVTSTTDALGNTTSTVYDAFGNAVKITDPRGNSGYFYYDANNHVRFHVDPLGYATEHRYDAFGDITQEVRYANAVSGVYNEGTSADVIAQRVATGASVDDRQTTKAYDRLGQVTTITYQGTSTSYTETFAYDAFGNKIQYKDRNDAVFDYEYDRLGHVKKEIAPATDVVTAVLPITTLNTRLTNAYEYDAFGNRRKMTEAAGLPQLERMTVYGYDKLGRQTHVEAPAFSVFNRASGTSTMLTPATDATYDAAGNLVMQTAPGGGRVLNYYDALNRKVASVDADNVLRENEYDAGGNLIRERTYDTRLTGTLTWQTRPAPVNADAYREMRYRYNANNLRTGTETRVETLFSFALLQSNDPGRGYHDASVVTLTDYNANGDIVRTADGNGNRSYQFYDAIGNRVLRIDPLGYAIRWEYNAEGQVKSETRYALALPAANLATLNAATVPAGLAAVNPQSLIDAIPGASTNPDNRVTEYYYDRLGRVTTERKKAVGYASVNATNGQLTELQGDLDTRFEYDGNGKVKAVVLPGAQGRTDYTYDALGRRTQELDPQFQAFNGHGQALVTTREETHWAYDAFGDVAVQTKLGLTASENQETRSQYDSAGRLRSQVDPEGATISYDYDIAGNVLRRSRQVTDVDSVVHTYRTYYAYDRLNRETSCQDIEDEGTAPQVTRETKDTRYNAFGDIEAKGINGQFQEQYKYDRLGHLFFTNKDNGTPRLYVYDANGNAVLEVQAIDTDLSTVGGIPVTGPAQVKSFDPNNVQLTFTLYDARNQITDVIQPPMDYGDLLSTPVTTVTGTNALPTPLTDLALYQPPNQMTQVSGPTPPTPTPPLAQLAPPPWSFVSTSYAYGASIPTGDTQLANLPVPQSALNSLGLTVGTSSYLSQTPVETLSTDISADGLRKTVVERFTRTTVTTQVAVQADNTVLRTVTTQKDVIKRTTTFTGHKTEIYGTAGDTFTMQWTLDNTVQENVVDRSVNVTRDQVTWKHKTTALGSWMGEAGATPGAVTYTPPGNVTVNTVNEMVDNGEGGYDWSGYYFVTVTVPPINYGGGDPVWVTFTWENGSAVVSVPVDSQGNATCRVRYDGHGITVRKGNINNPASMIVLTSFGMDRSWYTASVPLNGGASVVSIRGLDQRANVVEFTSREGYFAPVWRTVSPDGSIEFDVQTHLNPGDWYDYDVHDVNGTLLNRVHGVIGGTNYNQYRLDTWDVVTPDVRRLSDGTNLYNVTDTQTPASQAQNNFLRNLAALITQGATHPNVIDRKQSYDAFGEVIRETDGNGNQTDLAYSDLGNLITKQAPTTNVHLETGAPIRARPTTHYYYDEVGQLVGTQDAASDLKAPADKYYSTRVLVNGRVEREFDAAHFSKQLRYDRLGNQRLVTDEVQLDTESQYDHDGRLKRVTRYDELGNQYAYDNYEYDLAGDRIAHTDALGQRETYLYDGEGRIRRHTSFAGRQTYYDYNYLAGIGGIGGYEKRTTTAGISGNDVLVDQTDYFGKIRYHKDLGGHEFTYLYNSAGWLKDQTGTTAGAGRNAQHIVYDYYQNGYLKSVADTGINSFASFQYDKNGNRTFEGYSQVPLGASQQSPYQVAHAEYDELNRVTHVRDEERFDIHYTYDANGNRRSVESTYLDLVANKPDQPQNFYYLYDKMNRFVTTMGERDLATGTIKRGSTGYDIEYDALGRRRTVYDNHPLEGGAAASRKESYTYYPINTVRDTRIEDLLTGAVRTTLRENDTIGRLRDYREFNGEGPTRQETRYVHYDYDADNLQTQELAHDSLTPNETRRTQYGYLANGGLASAVTDTLGAANSATVTLTYAYEKWDSYKESTVTIGGSAPNVYGWQAGTSTYAYDSDGHIARLFDSQANRTLTYVNNHEGRVMRRFEVQGSASPVIRYFYSLNGVGIGDVGTDKVPSRVDYAQALADYDRRTLENEVSRNGNWRSDDGGESGYDLTETVTRDRNIAQRVFPVTSADFDQNYQPISDSYPAHTAQSYVTRAGDNLRSVALALWGDASLWYLLADANGLSGSEQIPAGTRLTVPNVVTNVHNNAGTFRPYDPGLALGDTTPTLPAPPPPPRPDEGCGTFGMIVVMVVVIIICVITEQWYLLSEAEGMAGAAAAAGDVAVTGEAVVSSGAMAGTSAATEAAVAGAAAGNLAGQAVANMIGMQHGFSAESFISSVFTAGVGSAIGPIGSGAWGQAATAAVNNAIGQGVNIITGQQEKFDWRGVAAAALSAPVTDAVGKGVSKLTNGNPFATTFVSAVIRQGIDVAAHRGRDVNYGQIAANVFGSAIGASLAADLTRVGGQRENVLSNEELQRSNAEDAARDQEGSSLSDFGPRSTGGYTRGVSELEWRRSVYGEDPGVEKLVTGGNEPWGGDPRKAILQPGDEGEFIQTGGDAARMNEPVAGAAGGLTFEQDMANRRAQMSADLPVGECRPPEAFVTNEGGAAVGRTFGYASRLAPGPDGEGSGLDPDHAAHTAGGVHLATGEASHFLVRGGEWFSPQNLKYYSQDWGGNGTTLRSTWVQTAEGLRFVSRFAVGVELGIDGYQAVSAYENSDGVGAAVATINAGTTLAALGTGPVAPWIIGGNLLLDVTGAKAAASDWLSWRMTEMAERASEVVPIDRRPTVVSNEGGAAVAIMRPTKRP